MRWMVPWRLIRTGEGQQRFVVRCGCGDQSGLTSGQSNTVDRMIRTRIDQMDQTGLYFTTEHGCRHRGELNLNSRMSVCVFILSDLSDSLEVEVLLGRLVIPSVYPLHRAHWDVLYDWNSVDCLWSETASCPSRHRAMLFDRWYFERQYSVDSKDPESSHNRHGVAVMIVQSENIRCMMVSCIHRYSSRGSLTFDASFGNITQSVSTSQSTGWSV